MNASDNSVRLIFIFIGIISGILAGVMAAVYIYQNFPAGQQPWFLVGITGFGVFALMCGIGDYLAGS